MRKKKMKKQTKEMLMSELQRRKKFERSWKKNSSLH